MTAPANTRRSMADALLRGLGGGSVLLHLPAPAIPGDPGEQLGLATPQFQDVPLAPALVRRVRARTGTAERPREESFELLVSAAAVESAAGTLGFSGAEVLFAQAAGVLIDQVLYGITWITTAEAFGSTYLYRVGLRGTVASFT